MQGQIIKSWYFTEPPEVVWDYLTRPELIGQWLTKTDFQPILGQAFCFFSESGKITYCKVLELVPHSKLSYSWRYPSATDKTQFYDSTVSWTLIATDYGTELQLVHREFFDLENFMGHRKGWTTCGDKMAGLMNTQKEDAKKKETK